MGSALIDPGGMRHRVAIIRAGPSAANSWNEAVPGPPVETVRWASVTPVPGTERFANAENAASAPMRFVFRWKKRLVQVTDRLRHDGRIFEIQSVTEIGFREGWEVLATGRGE